MSRVAVVLFNLGGPDSPEAVRPFLRNLFSDPAIIRAPAPVRWLLARLISARRAPLAREIYRKMGGRSPILAETRAQAAALAKALNSTAPHHDWRVSLAMRYWHPFAAEAAREVAGFAPDRIVLLPLYPQFSTTTTASSAADWAAAAHRAGITAPARLVCCYPDAAGFIEAAAARIAEKIGEARHAAPGAPLRLLFSAHGLPKRIVERGDPYQWQVERTVAAITEALAARGVLDGAATVTCYQSRVGPLEWIGPATDAEIRRAAGQGAAIVVAPVAFVSEHSETLVELDIEYRALAETHGAAAYCRAPAVRADARFVAALAAIAAAAADDGATLCGGARGPGRLCPPSWQGCPNGS